LTALHWTIQPHHRTAEDHPVNSSSTEAGQIVPEHFLALLYGIVALALGATVWSAMAAVFGAWSLLVAPGLGWVVAWACRYGGRRTDALVGAVAWLLALAGVLLALFAFSAFSTTQASPDSGFGLHAIGLEYLRLFAEPPWFGSASVLLALAGARRALRDRPSGRKGVRLVQESGLAIVGSRPGAPRGTEEESGARAA
jgi:hypothetical protein